MSGFRARPEARAIAAKLPAPEEARVADVLAAAGPRLPEAIVALAAAIARLMAERVLVALHGHMLGAVAYVIVQQLVLRTGKGARG